MNIDFSYIASYINAVDPTYVLSEWNNAYSGRLVYDEKSDWFVREN